MRANKRVLITDLDDTLFDWFSIWFYPFNEMLSKIEEISGIERDILLPEIREVHSLQGTSEYAFLIQSIPSLIKLHSGADLLELYSEAIEAHQAERRKHMKLFPTVIETLQTIKQSGAMIVGYTESQEFYTAQRIIKMGLDGLIDILFSPENHKIPDGVKLARIRSKAASAYELQKTQIMHTPIGELKPNPVVLKDILRQADATPEECVYVGDKPVKDLLMAQEVGVLDVHARYGETQKHRPEDYELLRQVSHWTDEMIERERNFGSIEATPTLVLEKSFDELLNYVEFGG